ncbi:hypothetical protein EGW08_006189, partial [Elysia chlorotica]
MDVHVFSPTPRFRSRYGSHHYLLFREVFIFLFLCVDPTFGHNSLVSCGGGWNVMPYSGTCIKLFHKSTSWKNARKACQNENGDLVKIISKEMDDLLKSWIQGEYTHIGLHRNRSGALHWLNETTAPVYTNISAPATFTAAAPYGAIVDGQWSGTDGQNYKYLCEKVSDLCPPGWVPSAFFGTCVKRFPTEAPWHHARRVCQGHDGDLVYLVNASMAGFITDSVMSPTTNSCHWIGLNNIDTNYFKWLDYDDQITWDLWDDGRPQEGSEKCVSISNINNEPKWRDETCLNLKQCHYVCEKFA